MTLAGQKRIADEEEAKAKLAADELKRQRQLERNWKSQSKKLVEAAISKHHSLRVACVIFPERLMSLGFEIVELGDIRHRYYDDLPKMKINGKLAGLIEKFSDEAPTAALKIWRSWVDMDKELTKEIEKFLNKPKPKYEPGELVEHLRKNANFKRLSFTDLGRSLDQIQTVIEQMKTDLQISDWSRFAPEGSESLLEQARNGKYFFSRQDSLGSDLAPIESNNRLQIHWKNGTHDLMNMPRHVISAGGLSWLAGNEGQQFSKLFGHRIELAASEGKSEIILNLEAGILKEEDTFVGMCPNENFLTELITLLGYTCKTPKNKNQITYFQVTW